MLMVEEVMGDVMVMIEIMIEGEINHLALGCVRGELFVYGSPRKEKMIWSCFGERILRERV